MRPLPVLEIDGARFNDLEGFWDEVSRQLIPGAEWGRNLDAFNDILRGGFGTPEDGFVLRWVNSERSRVALGYEEAVRWLERKVERCHRDNVPAVRADLEAAREGLGSTLFDILVEIIVGTPSTNASRRDLWFTALRHPRLFAPPRWRKRRPDGEHGRATMTSTPPRSHDNDGSPSKAITSTSVGIVLCSDNNDAMVKITLPEDNHQVHAGRYHLYLPTEDELREELEREREEAERTLRLAAAEHDDGEG